MIAATVMRGLACVIAIAAVVDPSLRTKRAAPLPIALRTADGALVPADGVAGVPASARALRSGLEAAMPGALVFNTTAGARTSIVDGAVIDGATIPETGPVSFVAQAAAPGARVRVISVAGPRPVLPGWSALLEAEVQAHGVTPGSSSVVVLESHGIEIDRVIHRWTRNDERATVRLSFAPPTAGHFVLAVRALGVDGGSASPAMPTRVIAEVRRLRVLAFDPRPSWGSGFARRALEDNPDFEVVTRVRASRGLEVRTGAAPLTLTAAAIDPFDLVLVGAPEELSSSEIAALEAFAEKRGGAVVLMADRKPSGGYARLFGANTFEEALLDKPVRLAAADGSGLRGSEFVYPAILPTGAEAILTIARGSGSRVPVLSMPVGAGQVLFSGLLDAWRYRADDDEAFATFWRSQLGRAAAQAPRRLELTLEPGVASVGDRVRLRAAVRATDHVVLGAAVQVPSITARVISEQGSQQLVRLWPTAETGVFDGWFSASRAGRYDVQVETDAGTSADRPFVVTAGEPGADRGGDADRARVVASATGGVVATSGDLRPLVDHLRGLPRDQVLTTWHPLRSPWWGVAFVGLLCGEWTARRRRGLR